MDTATESFLTIKKRFNMKKFPVLFAAITFLTVACISQSDRDELLMQIASSQEYSNYKAAFYAQANLIALNQVDLNGIKYILEQKAQAGSLEAIGRESFSQVSGGLMWYDASLECEKRMKELNAKFNFLSLSKDQRAEISKLYEQITNGVERQQLIDALLLHRTKRQK